MLITLATPLDPVIQHPDHPGHPRPLHNVATSQEIPMRVKRIETCKFGYHRHKDGG